MSELKIRKTGASVRAFLVDLHMLEELASRSMAAMRERYG